MIVAREEAVGRPALAGADFTLLPGDPPRPGHFAAFRLHTDQGEELADDPMAALGRTVTIELALPAGTSVRRRRVPAVLLPVTTALALLLDVEGSPTMTATARAWASVMTAGLGLAARAPRRPPRKCELSTTSELSGVPYHRSLGRTGRHPAEDNGSRDDERLSIVRGNRADAGYALATMVGGGVRRSRRRRQFRSARPPR
jgi:hypothetical protein